MTKSLQEEREENVYFELLKRKEAEEKSAEELRVEQLENHLKECDKLLGQYEPVIQSISRLKETYNEGIQKKIESLHESIETLLSSQHGLIVASEKIDQSLVYFNELDSMKSRLSNPSHLILNESLVPTLNKLTECISFMESNPTYKDSQEFVIHYKHFQTQVLAMIRNYIINSIETTTKSVQPDSGEGISEGDSVFTLFYGRYQFNSHRIKSLAQLIEERVGLNENYRKFLDECHESYFKSRDILMGPVLSAALDEMVGQCLRVAPKGVNPSQAVVPGPSDRAVTEPGKVVTEPGKVVTESGKVVTEPGKVVTESGKVVTEPGKVVTESGKAVTGRSTARLASANYSELLRNSSRMLLHICKDEHHLFFQFFSRNTDQLE